MTPRTARRIPDARDDFVSGAARRYELPWRDPRAREDLMVQVNVKQPEALMLKINWIASRRNLPKREIVERALDAFATRELERMGVERPVKKA